MASNKRPKISENPLPTISTTTTTTTTTTGNETPSSPPTLPVDNLIEILVRLPVRSLIRFKSVSKQWLSLISDPHFCSRHTSQTPPFHSPASGLSLVGPNSIFESKDYEFVNLCKLSCPSFRNLSSDLDSSRKYGILQSCNGLFLLVSIITSYSGINYCVYNPTTKCCAVLPTPPPVRSETEQFSLDYNLAFDPSKSPHYRVVCVRRCNQENSFSIRIQIYESKTASWWLSDCGFSSETFRIDFSRGTFWNGSIHWLGSSKSLYFNVDEEYIREIPMPEGSRNWIDMQLGYFGVSGDHLHLVGVSWPKFNVYEMKRDYSGWFVMFLVDLEEFPIQFPETIQKNFTPQNSACRIICVVRGKLDDESYFVLHIPGLDSGLYFNVDEERASEMQLHLVPEEGDFWRLDCRCFGESGGHLHFVGSNMYQESSVYEMERDYSGWFVKFCVDLEEGLIEFWKSMMAQDFPNLGFSIICIFRCEVDEESYLMLHIMGKIVKYYIKTKTLDMLRPMNESYGLLQWTWENVHQFIESLAFV